MQRYKQRTGKRYDYAREAYRLGRPLGALAAVNSAESLSSAASSRRASAFGWEHRAYWIGSARRWIEHARVWRLWSEGKITSAQFVAKDGGAS